MTRQTELHSSKLHSGRWFRASTTRRSVTAVAAIGVAAALTACSPKALDTSAEFSHGYQLNEESLALIPAGSSRAQVLLSMGQPSTTLKQNGLETFYYISQTKKRRVAFETPKVVNQRVLAVYFTPEETVDRIANYGLKEGKVFDFVKRVTPTSGRDLSFMGQLLGAAGNVNPFGG
ncbi:MAG: outer membrane protein assembly factor BamE [Pseudomonadota bacterium]